MSQLNITEAHLVKLESKLARTSVDCSDIAIIYKVMIGLRNPVSYPDEEIEAFHKAIIATLKYSRFISPTLHDALYRTYFEIPDYPKCILLSDRVYSREKILGQPKVNIISLFYEFGHQCIYIDIVAKYNKLNPEKEIFIDIDPGMIANKSLLKAQIASGISINLDSKDSNSPELFRGFGMSILPSLMGIDQIEQLRAPANLTMHMGYHLITQSYYLRNNIEVIYASTIKSKNK